MDETKSKPASGLNNGSTSIEEDVLIDVMQLYISPTEDEKVVFEENLQLMDPEDQVIDQVTVAVEDSDVVEDAFMVYQYSEVETHLLRVQSHVNRALETDSELRRIKQLEKTTLLRITDSGSTYKVFRLTVEGRGGSREKVDMPKSSTGHLVLEGANIILLRKIALSRLIGRLRGHTINHEGELCDVEYEVESSERGGEVRVRRTVTDCRGSETMTTLLTADGRILLHQWSNSEWFLVSTAPQVTAEEEGEAMLGEEKPPSEPELKADKAAYFEKKEEVIKLLKLYLIDHSDIPDMIATFLKNLLFVKPDDVIEFADQFFSELLTVREASDVTGETESLSSVLETTH